MSERARCRLTRRVVREAFRFPPALSKESRTLYLILVCVDEVGVIWRFSMIELTTKVQDQPRGTTAQTVALNPSATLAKTIHEQLLAAVLLDSGDKREGVYMVTTRIEVSMYVKAFDQPFATDGAAKPAVDLTASVTTLDMSVRAETCMRLGNINTIADLLSKTEYDLYRIRQLGRTTLREIKKALAARGLSLKQREPLP